MEIGHHRVKLLSNSRSIRGFVEVVETTIFLICIHQYLKEGPNVRGGGREGGRRLPADHYSIPIGNNRKREIIKQ